MLGRGALGGVERHVQAILRNLDPARFSSSVIFLMLGGPIVQDLDAMGIGMDFLYGKSGWDPRLVPKLLGCFSREQPDLVHSHEMHTAVGAAMRLRPSIPWIHTEHCSFDHGPSPAKAKLLWRMFQGRIDSVLSVSTATGRSLCRNTGLNPAKLATVFNGIDVARFPPKDSEYVRRELGLPSATPLVGSVGRLVEQKGWPDFLAMADRLAAFQPDVHFVIVGDGPQRTRLEEIVRSKPWSPRCHFLGSRLDAIAIIGGLDLFVLTSLHEEMPTTLLEAFQMRTPAIGFTPEGGVSEILERAPAMKPRFLAARDPAALARLAADLLANEPERLALLDEASRVIERHFSMAAITRKLENRYISLIQARRR